MLKDNKERREEMKKIYKFLLEIKEAIRIKENTPSYVVGGLMGCAVSAILIAVRLLQFYCFN